MGAARTVFGRNLHLWCCSLVLPSQLSKRFTNVIINKFDIKRAASGVGFVRGYGYAGDSGNRAVAWLGGFRRQPAIFDAFFRRRGRSRRPPYPQKVRLWTGRALSLMACRMECLVACNWYVSWYIMSRRMPYGLSRVSWYVCLAAC